eukprot:5753374-Amphidinium_carterae.3
MISNVALRPTMQTLQASYEVLSGAVAALELTEFSNSNQLWLQLLHMQSDGGELRAMVRTTTEK